MTASQVPDFLNAKVKGVPLPEVISDMQWLTEEFTPRVQTVRLGECDGSQRWEVKKRGKGHGTETQELSTYRCTSFFRRAGVAAAVHQS